MDSQAVMGRASGENFPVASRVLPRRVRGHLLALYGFARLVDELGDGPVRPARSSAPGASNAGEERLVALDEIERDLDRAYRGEAHHPLLVRLQPTLRACGLPREPFVRLIEANRVDQRVDRYETWEQLRGYCELSATPVGELVLGVFGAATPARIRLSDAVCTALQLIEHCQDVAEDRDRGRVYLPREDLARCGASEADLAGAHAGAALRRTIAYEIARARGLLKEGAPLIDELRGPRERLAVAAFIAGGRAACDALERADWDVLAGPPRAGAVMRLRALGATLRQQRRGSGRAAHPSSSPTSPTQPTPPAHAQMRTAEAYRHCEAITRASAANFYYGIRLLAPARRRAMCAVYAFARRIDDIGDGDLPSVEKLSRLQEQDRMLAELSGRGEGARGLRPGDERGSGVTDAVTDPVLMALDDAYARFDVPPDALRALIAGVRMDVEGVHYETFDELVVYCRRVAGAIGRACLAIFALREPARVDMARADRLADDLGVALQIINILRDIREDADRGRVYLPAEDLRRYQVSSITGRREPEGREAGGHEPGGREVRGHAFDRIGDPELGQIEALVRFEAARAREWFDRGIALAPLLDRRSRACLLAMTGIYGRLRGHIVAEPERVLRERVSLPVQEKAWVAARSVLGGVL